MGANRPVAFLFANHTAVSRFEDDGLGVVVVYGLAMLPVDPAQSN
jgi:hypothetical protein